MEALKRSRKNIACSQEAQANHLTQDRNLSCCKSIIGKVGLRNISGYRGLASDTETELTASDSKLDFLEIVSDLTST